jgi:pilus assembly protein Flp/PilA
MKQAMKNLMALRSDRRAVTALEYGLIAALIAVVVIGSITALGGSINTAFSKVASSIGSANTK